MVCIFPAACQHLADGRYIQAYITVGSASPSLFLSLYLCPYLVSVQACILGLDIANASMEIVVQVGPAQ